MDAGQQSEGTGRSSVGMVCRTNPSVAIERRGEIVKLGGCRWIECACIHHTAYLVVGPSRSGHRSPSSRNTENARFPIEVVLRVKHALGRRAEVPLPFSFEGQHLPPTLRLPVSFSEEVVDLHGEGSIVRQAGGSCYACPANVQLVPEYRWRRPNAESIGI